MKRRTQGVLFVSGLAVVAVVALATVLVRNFDPKYCKTGFPTLISCTYTW